MTTSRPAPPFSTAAGGRGGAGGGFLATRIDGDARLARRVRGLRGGRADAHHRALALGRDGDDGGDRRRRRRALADAGLGALARLHEALDGGEHRVVGVDELHAHAGGRLLALALLARPDDAPDRRPGPRLADDVELQRDASCRPRAARRCARRGPPRRGRARRPRPARRSRSRRSPARPRCGRGGSFDVLRPSHARVERKIARRGRRRRARDYSLAASAYRCATILSNSCIPSSTGA